MAVMLTPIPYSEIDATTDQVFRSPKHTRTDTGARHIRIRYTWYLVHIFKLEDGGDSVSKLEPQKSTCSMLSDVRKVPKVRP